MIELAILSLDFMSFTNDKKYYNQKQGLFIGAPTSPCFTEIYIQRVEETHIYIVLNAPCLSNRKFDNTFAIISHELGETLQNRGGSRDFEKGWRSISTTMVGHRRKF